MRLLQEVGVAPRFQELGELVGIEIVFRLNQRRIGGDAAPRGAGSVPRSPVQTARARAMWNIKGEEGDPVAHWCDGGVAAARRPPPAAHRQPPAASRPMS